MEHRDRYINRGGRPLYSPRRPSSLTIETNASRALAYLYRPFTSWVVNNWSCVCERETKKVGLTFWQIWIYPEIEDVFWWYLLGTQEMLNIMSHIMGSTVEVFNWLKVVVSNENLQGGALRPMGAIRVAAVMRAAAPAMKYLNSTWSSAPPLAVWSSSSSKNLDLSNLDTDEDKQQEIVQFEPDQCWLLVCVPCMLA